MASISKTGDGRRSIQFVASDGKRKTIRLGKVSQRIAEEIKVKIEVLAGAVKTGFPIDGETAAWLARIGDDLHARLAAVGLVPGRGRLGGMTLEKFQAEFIADHRGPRRCPWSTWTCPARGW